MLRKECALRVYSSKAKSKIATEECILFRPFANEVNRYNESFVRKGRALGELGHPDGPTVNLDRVSHKITSLVQEGNNFRGKAQLLDTPMGKIAQSLIGEGVMLGVSSRGVGSLRMTNEGHKVVGEDFMLATAADIVADPSAPDAFVSGNYGRKRVGLGRWNSS